MSKQYFSQPYLNVVHLEVIWPTIVTHLIRIKGLYSDPIVHMYTHTQDIEQYTDIVRYNRTVYSVNITQSNDHFYTTPTHLF